MLRIESPGVLATVQDRGRIGWAHLGVPRAGALDAPAAALGHRLVGNLPDAAGIEVTLGGFVAVNEGPARWAALSGARVAARCGDRAVAFEQAFWWPAGARLSLALPLDGVRTYLAVAGGISTAAALGSRSTDLLAGVGPGPLRSGDLLPVGIPAAEPAPADVASPRHAGGLRISWGPREDWFTEVARSTVLTGTWQVRADSDRIGLRLTGPTIERQPRYVGIELASEPMVLGAVQVPPDGQPIIFLADHPPTGGYPVIGVVDPRDLWQCAQVRPGDGLRFRSG